MSVHVEKRQILKKTSSPIKQKKKKQARRQNGEKVPQRIHGDKRKKKLERTERADQCTDPPAPRPGSVNLHS